METKNKTFILTGAARIGKFVAEDLLAKGANLVISYRDREPEIKKSDAVLFVKADLTNESEVKNLLKQGKDKFGEISGLIHMAANYDRVPWSKLDLEAWNRSMDPIAKSAFVTCKLVADDMLNNPGDNKGKIVLISDWSVLNQPYKDYLAYNVAKSAVVGLTKSLAKELAPGIAVNCVAPGPIIRPPDLSDAENQEVLDTTPLKRWGGGEEISKAIMYLIDSDFMTGQVLYVDGGRSIV